MGCPLGKQAHNIMQMAKNIRKKGGTVRAKQDFDPNEAAQILRKAVKGLGTDEDAIIKVLAGHNTLQRMKISESYKSLFGKDLVTDLKGDLSGNFEQLCCALFEDPKQYDADQLRAAMKGLGTDEQVLIEIICTRSNEDIQAIKQAYQTHHMRNLENDLESETSGNFKRVLVTITNAGRDETTIIDENQAMKDADDLYQAGEAKFGTDEAVFNLILCKRSYPQLLATFDAYRVVSKKTIEESIKSETSGNYKDSLLAIVRCVRNKAAFFADQLYRSMKGLGTDDNTLIRLIVTRCEVDMYEIKAEFVRNYGQTLDDFIKGDCSGDYRKLLLELIRD
ncbi:annexin A4-like isoform X2 [Tubulanus polymorphus]|uniref:annexin A4-like isoform X2 n=1 Tax=Tubulanus polymorphus TaxID=672921 RepID=UPI003DA62B52